MLIVLTLSQDPGLCAALRDDLAATCGPHRFLSLEGAADIASGYDELVDRSEAAPDDVLCFLHEDARLHFDAAEVLPRVLAALPDAGVGGFCGSASQQPGRAWWRCPPRFGGVRQGHDDPVDLRFRAPSQRAGGIAVEPVDTVDGYALVLRRSVLDRVGGFGSGAGTVGWHGYDVDLCLRVRAAGFVNHVLGLPTSHRSWGSADGALAAALERQAVQWADVLDPGASVDAFLARRAAAAPPRAGRPSIHVYGLARDDGDAVDGFVASCADADGVHVLDLGSADDTVAGLAAHGVEVVVAGPVPERVDLARNLALGLVPEGVDVCVAVDVHERLEPGWRAVVEREWRRGATTVRHRERTGDGWWPPPQEVSTVRVHGRRGHLWMGAVRPRLWPAGGGGPPAAPFEAVVATVLVSAPDDGDVDEHRLSDGSQAAVAALAADGHDGRSALRVALAAATGGRWDDAIALVDQALVSGRLTEAERSLACLLRAEAPDAAEEWWLLRACDEDPTLSGAWLELADRNRRNGDAMGTWWAARWALAVDEPPPAPFAAPLEWRWMGHDLAAWAAWKLGRRDEARRHAFAALVANPFDERIRDDHRRLERAAAGAPRYPEPAEPAAVDVIVLSYAKSRREYDLTSRCIEALRAASPSVALRVVVVETNDRLADAALVADEAHLFGPAVTVVSPGGPFSYNTFLRAGITACDDHPAPAVLVLNNDIEAFSEGFVEDLLAALGEVDSVSPLGVREALWWRPPGDAAVVVDDRVSHGLVGWCLLIARRVLDQVGAHVCFPDDGVWYEQDTRYAEVLRAHGYRHGMARRARALHLQGSSHGLLGDRLSLPSDVREILRSLGVRGLRCAVWGTDDDLATWIRSMGPSQLHTGPPPWDDPAPFDRVVVLAHDGTPVDVDGLLRCWEHVRPAGWLVGRHPDAAAVEAALSAFHELTGARSAVRRGEGLATHWAFQAPS